MTSKTKEKATPKAKKEHEKEKETHNKKENFEVKIEELTNDLKRLQAEFDNYRKRTETERESFQNYTKARIIEKLFPVMDTFELAITSIKKPETKGEENLLKGMEMIFSQLLSTLETEGLEIIIPKEGKEKFNPREQEAVLSEKTKLEKNTIIQVLQKGYKIGDKIIRAAKVKVAQ